MPLCPTCQPTYENALARGHDGKAHYIETRCELTHQTEDDPQTPSQDDTHGPESDAHAARG